MLKFDAETTRILDMAYQGADFTARRRASFDAVRPAPGETILDIGCGNGMLTAELARAVGASGRVIGVDPSPDMLAAGKERCEGYACVEFRSGFAGDIPVEDGLADKAVSVQVFEYIDDISTSLDEMFRCVKPGGRVVISDLHFGTLVWVSDDQERMSRMQESWDQHFASGLVPEKLPGLIRDRGHVVDDVVPITLTDHHLKPDGMALMMMHLMKQFAVSSGHFDADTAQAWFDEQYSLARAGRFFFSMSQFVVVATKAHGG